MGVFDKLKKIRELNTHYHCLFPLLSQEQAGALTSSYQKFFPTIRLGRPYNDFTFKMQPLGDGRGTLVVYDEEEQERYRMPYSMEVKTFADKTVLEMKFSGVKDATLMGKLEKQITDHTRSQGGKFENKTRSFSIGGA